MLVPIADESSGEAGLSAELSRVLSEFEEEIAQEMSMEAHPMETQSAPAPTIPTDVNRNIRAPWPYPTEMPMHLNRGSVFRISSSRSSRSSGRDIEAVYGPWGRGREELAPRGNVGAHVRDEEMELDPLQMNDPWASNKRARSVPPSRTRVIGIEGSQKALDTCASDHRQSDGARRQLDTELQAARAQHQLQQQQQQQLNDAQQALVQREMQIQTQQQEILAQQTLLEQRSYEQQHRQTLLEAERASLEHLHQNMVEENAKRDQLAREQLELEKNTFLQQARHECERELQDALAQTNLAKDQQQKIQESVALERQKTFELCEMQLARKFEQTQEQTVMKHQREMNEMQTEMQRLRNLLESARGAPSLAHGAMSHETVARGAPSLAHGAKPPGLPAPAMLPHEGDADANTQRVDQPPVPCMWNDGVTMGSARNRIPTRR
eukprot:6492774-Amphidinium_carterae.1